MALRILRFLGRRWKWLDGLATRVEPYSTLWDQYGGWVRWACRGALGIMLGGVTAYTESWLAVGVAVAVVVFAVLSIPARLAKLGVVAWKAPQHVEPVSGTGGSVLIELPPPEAAGAISSGIPANLIARLDALEQKAAEAENRLATERRVRAAMHLACIRLLTLRMVEDALCETPCLLSEAEEAGMTEAQFSELEGVATEFVTKAQTALQRTPIMERLAEGLMGAEDRARAAVRRMPPEQRPVGADALAFQDYRIAVARFRHIVDGLSAYRTLLVRDLGEPLEPLNDMRTILM